MPDEKLKKGVGFDKDGKPYPGVSDKGERVTVSLSALRAEFGKAKGEEKYRAIALATNVGGLQNSLDEYAPDIQIVGATDEVQMKVAEVLNAKD